MHAENVNSHSATAKELVNEYSITPQEAERMLAQFGSDRDELDLLLGHKAGTSAKPTYTDDTPRGDFLFDI